MPMNPAKDRLFARLALKVLGVFEAIGLLVITLATLVAGASEINAMLVARMVSLGDLLMLFLYLEVLAMVGVYFRSGQLPVRFPIYIAIVALARYLVLDRVLPRFFVQPASLDVDRKSKELSHQYETL